MKHIPTQVRVPIEGNDPAIVRDEDKCIQCGQCKNVCHQRQAVAGYFELQETADCGICIHCGQCVNFCPVDSLHERWDYLRVKAALQDTDKVVFVQTSPSTRVGISEACGMEPGTFGEGKLVAALKRLGFKHVFDTNFAADLTIMEEATELAARLGDPNAKLPMFTSCCPAWVKFAELFFPEYLEYISTSRSPILMSGPTLKSYYAKKMNVDPEKVFNVAVTPCTAKKFEITRSEFNAAGRKMNHPEIRDMDAIITVRELAKWLKEEDIDFASLPEMPFDQLCGSGAGVIFANTGGVMEAALRTAHYLLTGEDTPKHFLNLEPVHGLEGAKEAYVTIGGKRLHVCVLHTTANARELLKNFEKEAKKYDFVEVMSCKGGCIGGGGQPKCDNSKRDGVLYKRIQSIYDRDEKMELRHSHHNPEIMELYKDYYGEPLSELAEELLHTHYHSRSQDLKKK